MKIVLLGTNGWYDNKAGNTISILIDASDRYVILDAGNGIHKLSRYMSEDKPAYLFLSHFHLDHIEGLHTLMRLSFPRGLKVFGQEGTREALDGVMRKPYSIPLKDMPFDVQVYELPAERSAVPFLSDVRHLIHASPCIGFRFEIDGRTIAYCTDTGLCENLFELGRNADLMITECSAVSGQRRDSWPHLAPEDAVTVATRTGAKQIVLVHFNASLYPTVESRRAVQQEVSRSAACIKAGFDDMIIEL